MISRFTPRTMSKDNPVESPAKQLPEAAKDVAQALLAKADEGVEHTRALAHQTIEATGVATHRATAKAREVVETASAKAGEALNCSKECVRRNPVSVVLGAVVFGAAIGFVVMSARRKPSFSERYVEDPLLSVRDALLTALSPVTQRMHEGYDAACDGVGRAMDRVHHYRPGRSCSSVSGRLSRVGNKLKFW